MRIAAAIAGFIVSASLSFAATTSPAHPDLTGIVIGDKQPLNGALVYIYTAGVRVGTSPYCPSCYADCGKHAATDRTGKFKIASLDPSLIFRILIVAEGYEPTFIPQIDPAKGPIKAELKRRKQAADVYHTVRGTVVDQNKRPVVGAEVSPYGIKNSKGRWWGATDGEVDPLSVTNDRGEFSLITREADIHVDLDVRARGLASAKFALQPTGRKNQLQLVRGGEINGRLIYDGKPIAGATVGLVQADRRVESFVGEQSIGTDKEGRFKFVNVKPREQMYVYAKMDSLADAGVAVPIMKLESPATDETSDVGDLHVQAAHTVRGVVKLSNAGTIPPNTRLLLSREDAWDSRIVSINEDGTFEVTGVPEEEVSISVRVRGYHLSDKNGSLDPMNSNLIGRVPNDISGLEILLEPGEFSYDQLRNLSAEERQAMTDRIIAAKKAPLRGVEKK